MDSRQRRLRRHGVRGLDAEVFEHGGEAVNVCAAHLGKDRDLAQKRLALAFRPHHQGFPRGNDELLIRAVLHVV